MIKLHKNSVEAENHYNVVRPIIEKRIIKVLNKGKVGRDKIIVLNNNVKTFLGELKNDVNLRNLILSSPENLPNIVASIGVMHPNFIIPGSDENLILKNIFITSCYDNEKFNKLEFVKKIKIDTCPYCNRSYIYYLSPSGQIKPEIDHFFPKSFYPFLGISFYNMIPACQTCNGFGAKEDKKPHEVDLVNPYLINNIDFKFTYKIKTIDVINPLHNKNCVEVKFKNYLGGHLSVFKLDKLYEQHSDHVLELIIKSKLAYSEKYREFLQSFNELKFKDEDIDRMILGNYSNENDIHRRPLSKLYQDIGKELKLIK